MVLPVFYVYSKLDETEKTGEEFIQKSNNNCNQVHTLVLRPSENEYFKNC